MSSHRRDNFYGKPCKKLFFWLKPFYMRTEFWNHTTFFLSNYGSLACKVGKIGRQENCG